MKYLSAVAGAVSGAGADGSLVKNSKREKACHRWDNAPDHPEIESFPHHFHNGEESNVMGSNLDKDCRGAFREVLGFIVDKLKELRTD